MFGSFARAALWAATVAGVVGLIGPGTPQALTAWSPSFSLAGGFVFGVGAALNGGCSLSTVQRLIDGELSTLATLVGLAAASHSARRSSPAVAFPLSPCPLRRG